MNPYMRAAAKFQHIRDQLAERASKRPEFTAKPERLQNLKAEMAKPVKPDKPNKPDQPGKPNGKPDR